MADNNTNPRAAARTPRELIDEIHAAKEQIRALLELLDGCGERPLNAASVHDLLQPMHGQLARATSALNEIFGR